MAAENESEYEATEMKSRRRDEMYGYLSKPLGKRETGGDKQIRKKKAKKVCGDAKKKERNRDLPHY